MAPTDLELVEMARRAAEQAYAPYSGFRVGAAVLTREGDVFTGANVENASYPVSSCAEATVVAYAVAQGNRAIDTVAVACIDARDVEQAYPCGRCRQILAEFDTRRILVSVSDGPWREHTLGELLPHRFRL
ncbi:MAG: cytidine deaminase [Acidimicrobiia bacterium]|jgi:cytidine deaminase|nr:MAG: cytidine deaminase [Acidimicrobiia bacterium]